MDTIFVLNTNRQVIDVLSNNGSNPSAPFFGDTYTSELDTGAESYEFTTINNARTNVTLEVGNYVLFKYNGKYKLFQIMETTDEHSEGKKLLTVYAEMAGMELRNDYCEPFTLEGNFINLLERVLQDTNWRVGTYSESLLYNIQSISYTEPKNVYSIIQENLATFGGVEIEFRVEFIGNQLAALLIDCYESGTRGNKKYRRFEYGKDVKGITRERNINDLATAVIGQGNNNITFKDIEWSKSLGNPCDKPLQQNFVVDIDANDLWNNGGKYIKTVHKVDTDDAQTLLQECWDYLQEIKQPKFDYDVDLALVAEDYQDIGVGDTNYVLDFDYQPAILLEARVGKLELSFADPRDNKCTLTNYKELVSILQQPVDLNTVGNMIQSHFPIEGEDIAMGAIGEGHINVTYYQAIKTDIMSATLAEVGTLIADKADITDLTAINADIENLRATKAEIEDLNATNGNITNLTSQVGQIETVINNHFTGTDAQILNITAENTTIDNAVIKNAMIDTVSADKVNAGTINTNNVVIESEDGGIKISGATQQFKDKEGHVRVQIGKDASGNFTFCLFSQDGVGILLDETGIKAGAVPDGLIVNDMVSDSANISGSKLDISSVITSINNNTTSIKSSVIKFDDTGQTLQVAFNELKTKVDTIDEVVIGGDLSSVIEQVTTNTTNIGVIQGQISSLISNTTITKEDGTVTQLKDEYNNTVSTVNSNTTKIGSLETNYNKVSGDLASVTSKQSTLEQNLDEVSSTLTQTTTTANAAKTQSSENKQSIDSMSTTLTSTTKTANEAKTQSSTNKQTIDSMSTTLTSTTNTANSALNKATTAQQNLDGFKTTVSNTYTTKTDADNTYATKSALSEVKQTADSITSKVEKDYATKSLVTQTANGINYSFSHSGVPNLLYNGNFVSGFDCWGVYSEGGWGRVSNLEHTYIVACSPGIGKTNYLIQTVPMNRYIGHITCSCKMHVSSEGSDGTTNPFRNLYLQIRKSDGNTIYLEKGVTKFDTWENVSLTCYVNANVTNIEVFCFTRDTTKTTHFAEVMLTEGDVVHEFSQAKCEMNYNSTTINTNGVTVYFDGDRGQGSSNLNYDGLTIYDSNGNKKAWFGNANSAYIDQISTNRINEPSVLKCASLRGCPGTIYVTTSATGDGSGRDTNNFANSVTSALNYFRETYGNCHYAQDLRVYVCNGEYWQDALISGWLGSGKLEIYLEPNVIWHGRFIVEECHKVVHIRTDREWASNSGAIIYHDNPFYIRASNVQISGFRASSSAEHTGTFLEAYSSPNVVAETCDIVNYHNVLGGWYSRFHMADMRGAVTSLAWDFFSNDLIWYASCPVIKNKAFNNTWNSRVSADSPQTNSVWQPWTPEYVPPAQPAENWVQVEQTFWATDLHTAPEGSGSGTTARSGCWGQGNWSSYKAHRGWAGFEGVSSWCSGGRNFWAQITMHRLATKHGNYGAVPVPKFVQSDGSSWSCGQAFALDTTYTINLPWEVISKLVNGESNYLQLWAGRSTNDYSFYDNVSLRVVCEKNMV